MRWRNLFRELIISVLPALVKWLDGELQGIGERQSVEVERRKMPRQPPSSPVPMEVKHFT